MKRRTVVCEDESALLLLMKPIVGMGNMICDYSANKLIFRWK